MNVSSVRFRQVAHLRPGRLSPGRGAQGRARSLLVSSNVDELMGDLPTIKHLSVGSIDMGNHVTQRQTGRNSMSRNDAAWE